MQGDRANDDRSSLLIGVLALQGAFEEHEACLHAIGCHRTRQVRTVQDLIDLDGIILPGGESTAMGLIGTTTASSSTSTKNMWESLQEFPKPIWGTCAGMILLAEQCVGTSAVIQDGQALIGGMNICVARNYFGSQVSSFEMPIPGPPISKTTSNGTADDASSSSFPGIFIRAPAILTVGTDVEVLGTVVATPCRQAAITLQELDRKIANGENVIKLGVVDAFERKPQEPREVALTTSIDSNCMQSPLRYKSTATSTSGPIFLETDTNTQSIELPGAADGTNARKVICAARKGNLLCTAFHPELTDDYRWHEYFIQMILESKRQVQIES
jgi:pyridoxal 5'-phosphate synthase pdxT subunit